MPFKNFHACRLRNPNKYDSFAYKNGSIEITENKKADGVFGIVTDENGKHTELQSVRFDKEKFTVDEAKTWCSDNDGSFETAI